ncbi:nitrilase-related carbon-nitrogen hydrolase [Aestuariivirga sp. YIM B02566]|uniref:Carbon-nitrogen hydrolase family protein n=1 Tax=Taklimakanibacter albus TaxID=2800327 RepID=A0ACC5RAK0_9HYPH|nr:nitrilase-related carbon-nitrogen hydrolase [Aestuariivirga sp. YIM B02566]MBK1869526.1 carbon-nitrogen hydrolase family protein [Aestuariivirga sp. YIM B02566]
MLISVHQTTTGPDLAANARSVAADIGRAAAAGAKLACFPEAVNILRGHQPDLRESMPAEGHCPVLAAASDAAKVHGLHVHLGSILIRLASGKMLNRGYLLGPDGATLATYDKIHLFDADLDDGSRPESELFDCGSESAVIETPLGRLGLSICFDLRFSHLFVALAEAGADIILVPSSFSTVTGPVHWLPLLKARAIETGCYVIAAAQCGAHEPPLVTHGHSVAISPWGEVLCQAGNSPAMLLFEADLTAVREARRRIPTLALRRPLTVRKIAATVNA